jgi:organic radical activating enzyme
MLQVDDALVDALHGHGFTIAIESNGTLPAHPGIDWVCISPKAGSEVVQRSGDELKLVWPQPGGGHSLADVDAMGTWAFAHHLVQPLDDAHAPDNARAAIALVMDRPRWRLTVQAHKYLGLR